jgi:hypothetical protein
MLLLKYKTKAHPPVKKLILPLNIAISRQVSR